MFGSWRKKTEILKGVILSGGHQLAKELPPDLVEIMNAFRHTAQTGDGSALVKPGFIVGKSAPLDEATRPIWEPLEVHGWQIQATMYLSDSKLYWLVHAERKNHRAPSENDVVFLDKILEHLGADPRRDMIIGPTSHRDMLARQMCESSEELLPFGWWTWPNRSPLLEIQVFQGKMKGNPIRIVPLGAPESHGYVRLDKVIRS